LFGSFEEEKNILFPLRIKPCCFGHTACRLLSIQTTVPEFWMCAGNVEKADQGN
jgi:hypothetical protein